MINTFIWLALGTGALFYGVALYKGLLGLRQELARAWQHIEALLQQRHEDLPTLVAACRPYPQFEHEVLEKLLQARVSAQDARAAGDLRGLADASQRLRRSLARIAATVEACPELKSRPTLRQLLGRFTGLENALADRREVYNRCVRRHNRRRRQMPEQLLARLLGFGPAEPLEAPGAALAEPEREAWAQA